MNKISVIMARGIEGCGVTKYTLEQTTWFEKHGYDYKIFAAKDKSYSRKNAHSLKNVEHFKFSDDEMINKMIEECNNSDIIIINSLPSKSNQRGKGSGEEAEANWIRALKSFSKPVVLIQHDHTVYSIKRNATLEESVEASSVIFAHSRDNDFSTIVKEMGGFNPLNALLGGEQKNILSFQPGMDFDSVRQKYWKPIEEQDAFHHKWIGRTTSWKGYEMMFKWHNTHLLPHGYLTTFEGIEKSPAWLGFKELSDFYDDLDSSPEGFDLSDRYGDKATVFSIYNNDELLHRMSRCGFGYQLSILKQKYIEKSIEYTHCEIPAVGTIPVFRKEYGERCLHRVTGDPLIKSKGNHTIWLSEDDFDENIKLIEKLSESNNMRDEWREGAYSFYKEHQDSEYVFKKLMDDIKDNI